jgi:hypothetical protein
MNEADYEAIYQQSLKESRRGTSIVFRTTKGNRSSLVNNMHFIVEAGKEVQTILDNDELQGSYADNDERLELANKAGQYLAEFLDTFADR